MGMGLLGALGGLGQAGMQVGQQMMQASLRQDEMEYLSRKQEAMAQMQENMRVAAEDRAEGRATAKREAFGAELDALEASKKPGEKVTGAEARRAALKTGALDGAQYVSLEDRANSSTEKLNQLVLDRQMRLDSAERRAGARIDSNEKIAAGHDAARMSAAELRASASGRGRSGSGSGGGILSNDPGGAGYKSRADFDKEVADRIDKIDKEMPASDKVKLNSIATKIFEANEGRVTASDAIEAAMSAVKDGGSKETRFAVKDGEASGILNYNKAGDYVYGRPTLPSQEDQDRFIKSRTGDVTSLAAMLDSNDPELSAQFDKVYGPGAAAAVRRLGGASQGAQKAAPGAAPKTNKSSLPENSPYRKALEKAKPGHTIGLVDILKEAMP